MNVMLNISSRKVRTFRIHSCWFKLKTFKNINLVIFAATYFRIQCVYIIVRICVYACYNNRINFTRRNRAFHHCFLIFLIYTGVLKADNTVTKTGTTGALCSAIRVIPFIVVEKYRVFANLKKCETFSLFSF